MIESSNIDRSSLWIQPKHVYTVSVEALRLVRGYVEAFGRNQDEFYTVCTRNPAKVVGLQLH